MKLEIPRQWKIWSLLGPGGLIYCNLQELAKQGGVMAGDAVDFEMQYL